MLPEVGYPLLLPDLDMREVAHLPGDSFEPSRFSISDETVTGPSLCSFFGGDFRLATSSLELPAFVLGS
eukprot:16443992-Heterocapsa_arctica.AAC.2